MQDRDTVAILFVSHVFDRTILDRLEKLSEQTADFGTLFVYADVHGENPGDVNGRVERFDFEAIRREYPRILGTTLVPGNCHLPLLHFFKCHPQFQYYWVIEYDVVFTGDWRQLFGAFSNQPADFLASHLRRQEEEPSWYWWKSIQAPAGRGLPTTFTRAFGPIQRLSHRALEALERRVKEGWVGHFECLVPTLLADEGYLLADFGGDGSYVPLGFRNRFYRSFSWPDGRLIHLGSMRFRPYVSSLRFARRNTLYHPVKPRLAHATSAPKRFFLELKERLAFFILNLARHPMNFSRALARLYGS